MELNLGGWFLVVETMYKPQFGIPKFGVPVAVHWHTVGQSNLCAQPSPVATSTMPAYAARH
jgi:hypothetical protein